MNKIRLTFQELESVVAAAKILSENLDKQITISELSNLVFLPEKKLKAGFQQLYKKGVHRHHSICRMEKAKMMLLAYEPLKAIAAATGYPKEQAFITAFRKEFKITPAKWRREQEVKSNNNNNNSRNDHPFINQAVQ